MKHYNNLIGQYGEDLSKKFLMERGYKILNTNFKCTFGEIDIISSLEELNCLCFMEVKSRYNTLFGMPREAITQKKIKKIKKVAEYYIIKNKLLSYNFRFDIVEVLFDVKSNKHNINIIENAF